jgi:DNA repair exonuclease SbcCD ATPase subunit
LPATRIRKLWMRTEVRRWVLVAVAGVLALFLLVSVSVVYFERSETQRELAGSQDRVAELEIELVRMRADLEEAEGRVAESEERAQVAERLQERLTELETELGDLREQLAEAEAAAAARAEARAEAEAAAQAAAQAEAEAQARARATPVAEPAPAGPHPCDQLGWPRDFGADNCAQILKDIEECYAAYSKDPDWEPYLDSLFINVHTGDIAVCDV